MKKYKLKRAFYIIFEKKYRDRVEPVIWWMENIKMLNIYRYLEQVK